MRSYLVGLLSSFALLVLACASDTKDGSEGPTENGAGGTNPIGTSWVTGGTKATSSASSNGGSVATGGTSLLGGTAASGGSTVFGSDTPTTNTAATGGSTAFGGSAAGGDPLALGGGGGVTSSSAATGGSAALGGSVAGGEPSVSGGTTTQGAGGATTSTAVIGGSTPLGGSVAGGDTSTEGGSATSGGSMSPGGTTATGGGAEGQTTSAGGTSNIGGNSAAGATAIGGNTSTGGQSGIPSSSGNWYGYRERTLGFATVRVTSSLAVGDCSITLDGLDDTSDHPLIDYQGTCVSQAGGWIFTLQRLTADMGDGPSTLTSTDAGYAELRATLWGDGDTKLIKVSAATDDSVLIDFSVNQMQLLITARRSPDDSKYSTRRGTYPEIEYLGFNAHGNPASPWLSLETMQLGYVGAVTSVTITVRGPAGAQYEDIAVPYDSDRQQYHANYNLPNYPNEGLWFVADAKVTTEKGSSSLLHRDTPYANFEQLSRTSSGYDVSGMLDTASYRWLAQDYAPPTSATQWLYVEAHQNGSSGERTDPALYAYRESSLTEWFAANDDGGSLLMPKLKLPVASGDRIYVEVQDIYRNGGAYSVFASLTDAQHGTTAAPTEDHFEPDDDATSARSLSLDEFQHHLFQTVGESDWLVVDIP